MTRAALTTFALFFSAVSAMAWEADPNKVDKRAAAVERWMAQNPDPRQRDPLSFTKNKKAPGWLKKTYWKTEHAGRTYHFGVGKAQGVRLSSLRATASEDRARGELAKGINSVVTIEERKDASGKVVSQSIHTMAKANLRGSQILDWYMDETDNTFYALAVLIE